ncbi:sensor histidine kinase [Aureimonas flava]|uniref:histidine kinase n=1 Tax=Aureimonas flava TaxID=2320271 RepID=A0A3A1WNX9_9HYPH|nr:HAMP domain-containing sensor histidine kinase [Aureimonas flava]RIY02445.1 sensor histidine kinase [Aureimonas flava]
MDHVPPSRLTPVLSGPAPGVLAARRRSRWPRLFRPTIAQRVFLVGAIPIALIALVGFLSVLLLDRADLARDGALEASNIYRQVVSGMSAQDAFVSGARSARERQAAAFSASVTGASAGLRALEGRTSDPVQASSIVQTRATLQRYQALMGELTRATRESDRLVGEMDARLQTLLRLTDDARERQTRSNHGLVDTLTARDRALGLTRDVVDSALALRAALADGMLVLVGGRSPSETSVSASFEMARMRNAAARLAEAITAAKAGGAGERAAPDLGTGSPRALRDALERVDRQLKVDITAQRTLQGEISNLLAYTVDAHETEQATQNIAVDTLKLARYSREVIGARKADAIPAIDAQGRSIGEKVAALPISPRIQSEMIDALDEWRSGLRAVRQGLEEQSRLLIDMSDTAGIMLLQVSGLNNDLSRHADAIGSAVRRILLAGGGMAFLLASGAGLMVARSITKPLHRLERGMIARASRTDAGLLPEADRLDELGSMARATNNVLQERDGREAALRRAKEESDETLLRLRETQADLIQAEKLASLGQLVAGVAHEINTPLGVALTTATTMAGDVRRFEAATADGRVTREAFSSFVARMAEGTRLTTCNVERAAGLVHAFKQVAADQASGERREFEFGEFARDLFTSLGPLRKRAGHELEVACEPGLRLNSYPGALAQVLTNLLSNAYAHAYAPGQTGTIRVEAQRQGAGALRIAFSDDGRGIAREDRPRVFDPFFTTGRATGSTGLGLHIVFNLVTATLGGSVSLAGGAGPGTTFWVDLPLDAPRHDGPARAAGRAADAR